MSESEETEPCKICGGTGRVPKPERKGGYLRLGQSGSSSNCLDCKGTGRVPIDKEKMLATCPFCTDANGNTTGLTKNCRHCGGMGKY